ncbi:MAG: GGDEF domain-containing protein [Solirubrobacterales bacterium]
MFSRNKKTNLLRDWAPYFGPVSGARLNQLSETQPGVDHLTGLPNRSTAASIQVSAPFAILFCDLNKFKPVNDSFGHAIGDAILQAFAQTLVRSLRAGDLAIRWGGDEFVAVLPGAASDLVEAAAERLKQLWNQNQLAVKYRVSVSVGCAVSRDQSVEQTVAEADARMYQEKNGGRGSPATVVMTQIFDLTQIVQWSHSILIDLHGGLSAQVQRDDLWKSDCRLGLQAVPLELERKNQLYGLCGEIEGLDDEDLRRIARLVLDRVAARKRVLLNVHDERIAAWAAGLGAVTVVKE